MPAADEPRPMEIFIDADACPVKAEVYKVAQRYGLRVHVVSNAGIMVPPDPLISRVLVDRGPDAADDWIVEHARAGDIVVTADIPLAARCLKQGALVIGPTGKPFTDSSIGLALAQRSVLEHLRATGEITGGSRPFATADRSRFLSALDEAVNRSRRNRQAR